MNCALPVRISEQTTAKLQTSALEGNLGLLLSKTTSWVNTSGADYTHMPTMCVCNDEVSVLL